MFPLVVLCALGVAAAAVVVVINARKNAFDAKSLVGKRVLVTGASSGIGAEIAYFYARHGASLVITAPPCVDDQLKAVAKECRRLGSCKVHTVQADITAVDDCERIVAETKRIFADGLDHLILNHGVMAVRPWSADEVAVQEQQLTINFVSYQRILAGLIDLLIASKGHVGVTSSGTGKIPVPYGCTYSATKHAVQGFFGSLRIEFILRETGVSVTVAVLGLIKTEAAMTILRAKFGDRVNKIPSAPADKCAAAIVQAVTVRDREVYYPANMKYLILMHQLCPSFYDSIVISFFPRKN